VGLPDDIVPVDRHREAIQLLAHQDIHYEIASSQLTLLAMTGTREWRKNMIHLAIIFSLITLSAGAALNPSQARKTQCEVKVTPRRMHHD
jgi:hypothetical protein